MKIPEHKRPKSVAVKRSKMMELDIGYFGDYALEHRIGFLK
jgi:hypothetical protein